MTSIPPPRTTSVPQSTVSRRIVATYVHADGQPPRQVTLRWSTDDPLAVRFRFPASNGTKHWAVARELILDALANYGGAGEGDARFIRDPFCSDFILLELDNPNGYGLVRLRRRTLESFLAATISHESTNPTTDLEMWLANAAFEKKRSKK